MLRLFILAIILFPISAIASGQTSLNISDIHAYETSAIQKNGAVFMTIKNGRDTPLKILSAVAPPPSPIAEKVELHTHTMDGEIMMMREVEYYEVPANGTLKLEPMGHHIMLIGLKMQLKAGTSFPLALEFEDGSTYKANVEVRSMKDMR